jgi:hypothetical protein
MKSLSDAVAESARNQKLADLFKAEHQRKEFADALNIHSTMSVMDLLKGDSMGTDQDEITRMETLGNLTKIMDDATADELWQIIGNNEVFVETLNSNWRDLYNKLVVQFSDKKGSKSAIFNFIYNYIGQQTQFLNKPAGAAEEDWENLDEATTTQGSSALSSISDSRLGSSVSTSKTSASSQREMPPLTTAQKKRLYSEREDDDDTTVSYSSPTKEMANKINKKTIKRVQVSPKKTASFTATQKSIRNRANELSAYISDNDPSNRLNNALRYKNQTKNQGVTANSAN